MVPWPLGIAASVPPTGSLQFPSVPLRSPGWASCCACSPSEDSACHSWGECRGPDQSTIMPGKSMASLWHLLECDAKPTGACVSSLCTPMGQERRHHPLSSHPPSVHPPHPQRLPLLTRPHVSTPPPPFRTVPLSQLVPGVAPALGHGPPRPSGTAPQHQAVISAVSSLFWTLYIYALFFFFF